MNPNFFQTIIKVAKSINYKKVFNNITKLLPYAKKAKDIYEKAQNERKIANKEGQTSRQYFYSKVKNVANEIYENIDIEGYISEQFENIANNIKETIGEKIGIEDIDEFIDLYKEFLNGNEEVIEELIPYIQTIIDEVFKDDELKEKIGDNLFKTLTAMVIHFGLKINKGTYDFAINKINNSEFKTKIRNFYEDYIVSVVNFINENEKVKEYSKDVVEFATGNKATAIISTIGKVTNYVTRKVKDLNINKENIFDKAKNVFKSVKKLNPFRLLNKEQNYEKN